MVRFARSSRDFPSSLPSRGALAEGRPAKSLLALRRWVDQATVGGEELNNSGHEDKKDPFLSSFH